MDIILQKTLPSKVQGTDLMWIYTEKPDVYHKFCQYIDIADNNVQEKVDIQNNIDVCNVQNIQDVAQIKPLLDIKQKQKNITSDVKQSNKCLPIDIIIHLAGTTDVESLKSTLQSFISQKAFSVVFGVKKCSEVMTGITNNKWDKSLILFLSFLFYTKFTYLNKEVAYNIDKCNTCIIKI